MKKLFALLSVLMVFSSALSACGGSGNTSHTAPEITPIEFPASGGGPVRLYNYPDQTDWVDITYNGDGTWSCASNFGDGTSVCLSQVGSTISFFWGTEKVGTADSNIPGILTPEQGWEDKPKG